MKVLTINTSERDGGAAIAARRLTDVLNRHGVEARMVVRDGKHPGPTTRRLPRTGWQGLRLRAAFVLERVRIWLANGFRRDNLWAVDLGVGGAGITDLPEFRAADIIHLHWVNQGFLSLGELGRILRSGKPVVWTMHDMWPCTGICHHARDCESFHSHCHDCPQLRYPGHRDLSFWVFDRKASIYPEGNLTFVGCSRWIAGQARSSRLLAGREVVSIPNTYNHRAFCPGDKELPRRQRALPTDLKLVLFACQKITNPRKGLDLLLQALRTPVMQKWQGRLGLVVVGQMSEELAALTSLPMYRQGYVEQEEDMAELYRAVDLFVTPSLEENLPNTIMEAMATGTPCVGFDIGGVPEMIDHGRNGYVARYRDAEDLARGMDFVLNNEHYDELARDAAEKARSTWNEDVVADQYIQLYRRLLGNR